MNVRTRRTAPSWWLAILVLVLVLVAAVAAYTGKPALITGEAATVPPQDVARIESRISLLEQRFYSIETSIRGLEQQSRLSSIAPGRTERDPEVGLLRAEVEALRQRLAEIECGLVRVDERTLTAAAKEARRKSGGSPGDPCRLNADAPLRLPARP
ncbi:MAG TPA: hypothetical protein VD835_18935 [Pyrinomonadaceae bacterium]|nr:hypothetical protein [Pyrinomonadaceae bacterium]